MNGFGEYPYFSIGLVVLLTLLICSCLLYILNARIKSRKINEEKKNINDDFSFTSEITLVKQKEEDEKVVTAYSCEFNIFKEE